MNDSSNVNDNVSNSASMLNDVLQNALNDKTFLIFKDNDAFKAICSMSCLDELETYVSTNTSQSFLAGVSSLVNFIRVNWFNVDGASNNANDDSIVFLEEQIESYTEEVNENIQDIKLLILAKQIFQIIHTKCPCATALIWLIRSLVILQYTMSVACSKLCHELDVLTTTLQLEHIEDVTERAKLSCLLTQIYLFYGKVNKCDTYISLVKEVVGLTVNFTGELGRRSKHQQTSLPQIKLLLKLSEGERVIEANVNDLPNVMKLDDDVRYDSIVWDGDAEEDHKLSKLEQSALLLEVLYAQRCLPDDGLMNEKLIPMIDCVLKQSNCWTSRLKALYLRSMLEYKHKRTIERAVMQIEELVNNMKLPSESHAEAIIFDNFFAVVPPHRWELKESMGDLLFALGMVKSALDVYESTRAWEEVIMCYNVINNRHKAAEVILQELAKKRTVKLLCLLGDATDDKSCYAQALEEFGHNKYRPHRHWGLKLYSEKKYEEAIPHLEKSLEINSLQEALWLRVGYAAIQTENWPLAAKAYQRYTCIEPSSFEAWNNLARVYIAQNNKPRAFKALMESIRTNYDSWQVWDNLMVISLDTGHFNEVIMAYHRLLDLKDKHLDVEVMAVLVSAILGDVKDFEGKSIQNLRGKCLQLLGRLTSIFLNEWQLWEMYGDLTDDASAKIQKYQRAYRAIVQGTSNWCKNADDIKRVLNIATKLAESVIGSDDKSQLFSVKLILNNVNDVLKNTPDDLGYDLERFQCLLEKIEQL